MLRHLVTILMSALKIIQFFEHKMPKDFGKKGTGHQSFSYNIYPNNQFSTLARWEKKKPEQFVNF